MAPLGDFCEWFYYFGKGKLMPYIKDETKEQHEPVGKHRTAYQDLAFSMPASNTLSDKVDAIIEHIRTHTSSDRDGMCNYAISRIVTGSLRPSTGWGYKNLNRAYGTFLSAAAEMYRRLIVPYEEKCIEKNGDIPEYEQD